MNTYTVEEFQNNFDNLIGRVENGEHITIINDEGQTVVMVPADDELVKIHTQHNDAP